MAFGFGTVKPAVPRPVRHRATGQAPDMALRCRIVDADRRHLPSSWFRSRGGRRFGFEFAAIVVAKLVALALLWFFCIRPMPRADTAPAAVESHLLAPAETPHDR